MNISSKLIFLLTIFVGLVMLLTSFLFLLQRESALQNALQNELKAHAVTLQTALEENYAENRETESQRLIDRLRRNSQIYAVLLFDEKRELIKSSQPDTEKIFRQPPELENVLSEGKTVEFSHEINGRKFISIVMPIQIKNINRRAFEIVKPLDLIEKEIFNARINWLAMTLFLLAVIFLVVILVLRQSLSKPINELLKGAEKIGSGDLDYRVKVNKNGDELAILAANFNQMADNLAKQREKAETEAENRLRLERELRHNERLASVGRLAAGVAHEIGTPLNVIDARAAQILEKPNISNEKKEKNLKTIRRQSERITHLVHQLLNLARPFDLNFAKIELNQHIKETVEQIFSDDERIIVKLSSEKKFYSKADSEFLRQVWINILQNARQAIQKQDGSGGKIFIDMQIKEKDKFVSVIFRDTGEGIETEHLEKIFDPFYTTKDIGQGTGLGLAVAHRIIEEHGGSIEVSNDAEKGAVFKVYLPIWEENK